MKKRTWKEFKRSVRKSIKRLKGMLDGGAPASVIGTEISILFRTSVGVLGGEGVDHFVNALIADCRQSVGLCHLCDNAVRPHKSNHPLCARCAAEEVGESFREELESEED